MSEVTEVLKDVYKGKREACYVGGSLDTSGYVLSMNKYYTMSNIDRIRNYTPTERYWWCKCYLKYKLSTRKLHKFCKVVVNLYNNFMGKDYEINFEDTGYTLEYFISNNTQEVRFGIYKINNMQDVLEDGEPPTYRPNNFLSLRNEEDVYDLDKAHIDYCIRYIVEEDKFEVQFNYQDSGKMEFTELKTVSDFMTIMTHVVDLVRGRGEDQ